MSRALVALEREIRIEPALRELVKLRASILNGCAYCIDMHTKDARKAGESEQRLYAVAAWQEAPFFSERERAALALTDAVTLIAGTHVPVCGLRRSRPPLRTGGARPPDLADRRDQRLEPDRDHDPTDRRRIRAVIDGSRSTVSLHYGDPQIAIGAIFAVLALALAGAFLVIGVQAGSEASDERVHRIGYWLRKRWLALLLVLGVLVVGISLFDLPYASGGASGRTVVKVTGGQFFWSLAPDSVPVGTRIRFDVTSIDVNHGFGLYDPHGRLIGSVQAMPGYHNELDLALNEAGVYRIRCLELCGLNHSTMQGTFTVSQH